MKTRVAIFAIAAGLLLAAASFGGAAHDADVVAPGGTQRVEWRAESVYLTGWAEVLFEGTWLKQITRASGADVV